jgi:hypothetical protein
MATALPTGPQHGNLEVELGALAAADNIGAAAIASAYASVYGVRKLEEIRQSGAVGEIRLIVSLAGAITHPQALRNAAANGWKVRTLEFPGGIFHSKLFVFGAQFNRDGRLANPASALIGSANLTKGGLASNLECAFMETDARNVASAANSFHGYWTSAAEFTAAALEAYERRFAQINRKRNIRDLVLLGIADEVERVDFRKPLRQRTPPSANQRTFRTKHANVAWAGLESFTGEYAFQVEFPRDAGTVLQGLVRGGRVGRRLRVLCADGVVREMPFGFYPDNSMFRLNVPNDTPGVAWARQNKKGLAVVAVRRGDVDCELSLLKPGKRASLVMARSMVLGTWGRTPTRYYGWY